MSGFEKPNYTQAPNAFFDRVLKEIDSMSELKVTLAVIRHTMGFHRDEHELSLSYLVEYTGLRKETVIDGLRRAMKRGTVTRKESGQSFAYSMKVVGKPDHLEGPSGRKTGPQVVGKPDPRKKEKESVEANASSGMGNSAEGVGLEKYIVDGIYLAMKEADFRLPNEHFKYHLGRAKDILEKDSPADEEIEALPRAFVDLWTIKGKADAHSALMELRRQKARPDLVKVGGPPPWEPVNPHSPKPPMDPAAYEREKKRREEVAAMLRSVS